ncbi:MAG: hypothetical protein HC896_16710 [Bacteroidales bacterium]|nr:hypothetical protein [Bacteroidales bacterium]
MSTVDQDILLLEKYKQTGDQKYLAALFEHYFMHVYGLGIKYLMNRDDAKDLTMLVYEKLFKEVKKQDIKNFKSWLYVLARNECLMWIRKRLPITAAWCFFSSKKLWNLTTSCIL